MPLSGQPGERVAAPALERAALDRPARVAHEVYEEAQIMQAQEPDAEDLLLVHEMADVGAAELPAGGAAAMLVERAGVALEPGVPEIEPPLPRQRASRPSRARRQHAVEHVDAFRDDLDDAFGITDPHEVARLAGRQAAGSVARRLEHRGAVFADGEPADRVAVEVERDELLARAPSELGVEAALCDREAQLARRAVEVALLLRPERRPPHRALEL